MNEMAWDGTALLTKLLQYTDVVLSGLRTDLERYSWLQNNLLSRDVSTDKEYQTRFNGYYRIQRRNPRWYAEYFGLLQTMKIDRSVTFDLVVRELFARTGSIESSFASKLVATIRPGAPVYDKHVRENLDLQAPRAWRPPEIRLSDSFNMYAELAKRSGELVGAPAFVDLRNRFDAKWGEYAWITDAKKLDLLLWRYGNLMAG